MSKRIISFVLAMLIVVSGVASASAVTDNDGLIELSVSSYSSDYWSGDMANIISNRFGNDYIQTTTNDDGEIKTEQIKGTGPYIIRSKVVYNLGDRFEISFNTNSDNQNPNSNNRMVFEFGNLTVAYFSYGSHTDDNHGVARVYYGANILTLGGSAISYNTASNKLIGETGDIGINTKSYVIKFDSGNFEFYCDNALAFSIDAADFDSNYDFTAVRPAVMVYKRSSVWTNGMYSSSLNIKAEIDGNSVNSLIGGMTVDSLTYNDIANVSALRNWYDALSDVEKAKVTDYNNLVALESRAKELEAEHLNGLIAAIDVSNLKLKDKGTVVSYRNQYDALSDAQKLLVTDYDNLVAAEAEIVRLEILKADTDAANIVNAEILAMGEITYKNYLAVKDARGSYEKLTAQGKTLVADYAVLTAAEETVKNLRKQVNYRLVNSMIEALPDTVTMANDDAVFNAVGAYSLLCTAEQCLVVDRNKLIDDAATLVKLEADNNTMISPKIVSLKQLGQSYNGGVLPNADGYYFGEDDTTVDIYEGDTVKPGVYWSNCLYEIEYNDDGSIKSSKGTGTCYNVTTNAGGNWWGSSFQPLSNGATRNARVGELNYYNTNIGKDVLLAHCVVKERPTYEYDKLFDVAMNVRLMIASIPKEYSKITEDDRYIVESANAAYGDLNSYDIDEVHEIRYLINAEKTLKGIHIDDEKYDYVSTLAGDINNDYKVNSIDLLMLEMHILDIAKVVDTDRCDINADKVIDSADLLALQSYLIGVSNL